MKYSRLLIVVALGLGLTLALLWVLRGSSDPVLAHSSLASVPPSLTRQHAPVIISGSLLSDLTGNPLDEIFVYAYQGASLTQIPFQIDERDADGMYVVVEDGLLDDNDELVFMAIDGGAWVDDPWLDAGGTLITPTYVITLTDPVSNTNAWAYIFHSDALSRTFSTDYVSYDGVNDRIISPGRYSLGFNATYGFIDYLTLGDGSSDLLDRSKMRITGTVLSTPFSFNEEDITLDNVHAIDGPVRVTRISTSTFTGSGISIQGTATLFAYRSLIVQAPKIIVLGAPAQTAYQRTSMDWNEQASGMILYDANNPAGTTIDGSPDTITVSPPTRWIQVTGITGTVVSVNHIPAGLGGTQSTYYRDDVTVDSNDTGDQRSYGDAGLQVENPNPGTYTILGHTYFLTGTFTNVGAIYADLYDNPLQVNVSAFVPPSPTSWISVTAISDMASIYPGDTAVYTLSLTASEGFVDPVTLTLQGAPPATTVSFDPDPVTPPSISQLSITTTLSTTAGTYSMMVTGAAETVTDTVNLTLIVALATPPSFTLNVSPTVRAAGPSQEVSYTVFVTGEHGFSQPVSLTVVGLPTGIGVAWSTNPVTPDGFSILTLSISSSPPFGHHPFHIVGEAGTLLTTEGIELIIDYFKVYMPMILRE